MKPSYRRQPYYLTASRDYGVQPSVATWQGPSGTVFRLYTWQRVAPPRALYSLVHGNMVYEVETDPREPGNPFYGAWNYDRSRQTWAPARPSWVQEDIRSWLQSIGVAQ